MRSFKRVHSTGMEALISQHPDADAWRIQINFREPHHSPMTVVGYLAKTVNIAKTIADQEILKLGHVCNAACKDWRQIQTNGNAFQAALALNKSIPASPDV